MDRMKTFLQYLVLFVLFYIFVTLTVFGFIITTYYPMNKDIQSDSPRVVIVDAQSTYINGYVKGKILNNTKDTIEEKYLKFDFRDKHDDVIVTKYMKIENVESLKWKEFEVRFNAEDIKSYTVSVVDQPEKGVKEEQLFSDPSYGIAKLMSTVILLYFL